jgi:hypothetical protein
MLQPYLMPLLPVIQGEGIGQMRGVVEYHSLVTEREMIAHIVGNLLRAAGR